MAKYLSLTEYNRWFRSYQLNLDRYLAQLDALRLALGLAPETPQRVDIEHDFDKIDELLEKSLPRNFLLYGEPLSRYEVLVENFKVLINLICKGLRINEPFWGIYQAEKNRVLKLHNEYKFKDKFLDIKEKVDALLLGGGKLDELEKEVEEQKMKDAAAAGAEAAEKAEEEKTSEDDSIGF